MKKGCNCKKHLVPISEDYGIKVKYGIKVVGFRLKCGKCGKLYRKIIEQEHPFIPTFTI